MLANHRTGLALWLLGALVVGGAPEGCKTRLVPEGQCLFNDDCESPLICAGRYCRAQCRTDADCAGQGSGWHCGPSGQADKRVCLPPEDRGYCVYASECDEPLVCTRDGRCAAQCVADRDCTIIDRNSVCIPDAGICSFRTATDGGSDASTDASTDTSPQDTPSGG